MWNSDGLLHGMNNDMGGDSPMGGLHAGGQMADPMKKPNWQQRWRGSRFAGAIGDVGRLFGQQRPDPTIPPMQLQNYGIMDQYKPPMQWQSPDIIPRQY